jgi:hypothetical protein
MRYLLIGFVALLGCEKTKPTPTPASASVPVQSQPATLGASIDPVPVVPPTITEQEHRLGILNTKSSSFLDDGTPRAYTRYHPYYAFDDNPATAWNEGSPTSGAGEFIEVEVPRLNNVSRLRFVIKNGFQKPEKLFAQNARVKTLLIELPNEKTFTAKLPDSIEAQEIIFPVEVSALHKITFKVIDVYEGSKFADLCISDIQIFATSLESPSESGVDVSVWSEEQKAIARENKQLAALGIPLEYTIESLPEDAKPFSEESEKYIAAARSLLNAEKVIAVDAKSTGPRPSQYAFGLECDAFESEDEITDAPEDWDPDVDIKNSWMVPCVEDERPEGLPGYILVWISKPDPMSWDVSYWSTTETYKNVDIRTVRVREAYDDRSGQPQYKIPGAAAYDLKGHLRAYVKSNSEVYTFEWSLNGTRDFLLGGFHTITKDGKTSVTRLVPVGMPLPKELEYPLASSQPSSQASSQPLSLPTSAPTSAPAPAK